MYRKLWFGFDTKFDDHLQGLFVCFFYIILGVVDKLTTYLEARGQRPNMETTWKFLTLFVMKE